MPAEAHVWKPFVDSFSGNLAVFCSDERFAAATLEFLRGDLGMDRCDLFVVAGGPAFVVKREQALLDRLDLLVTHHHIRRLVLITHADCGFYKHHHKDHDAEALTKRQLADALHAVKSLHQTYPGLAVEAYCAATDQWGFAFMPVTE